MRLWWTCHNGHRWHMLLPRPWGCLPMSDPSYEQTPYEQVPTKPALQVALN